MCREKNSIKSPMLFTDMYTYGVVCWYAEVWISHMAGLNCYVSTQSVRERAFSLATRAEEKQEEYGVAVNVPC